MDEEADTVLGSVATAPLGKAVNSIHKTGFAFDMSMESYQRGRPELPYLFARDQAFLRRMVAIWEIQQGKKREADNKLEARLANQDFNAEFDRDYGGLYEDLDPPELEKLTTLHYSWVRWQVFLPVASATRDRVLPTLQARFPGIAVDRWYQNRIRPWKLDYGSRTGGWFRNLAAEGIDLGGYCFLNVTRAAYEACRLERIGAFREGWQGAPPRKLVLRSDRDFLALLQAIQDRYNVAKGRKTRITVRRSSDGFTRAKATLEQVRPAIDFWLKWFWGVAVGWRVLMLPGSPFNADIFRKLGDKAFAELYKQGCRIGWAALGPGDFLPPEIPPELPKKTRDSLAATLKFVQLTPEDVGAWDLRERLAAGAMAGPANRARPRPQLSLTGRFPVQLEPYLGEQRPVEWWHFQLESHFTSGGKTKTYAQMMAEVGWTRAGLLGFDWKTANEELYRRWGLSYPPAKIDGAVG
jgi:hypothetical protein